MDLTAQLLNARAIAIYVRVRQNVKGAMMDFISTLQPKFAVAVSANKIVWPAQVPQAAKYVGQAFLLIMVNAKVAVLIATNVTQLLAHNALLGIMLMEVNVLHHLKAIAWTIMEEPLKQVLAKCVSPDISSSLAVAVNAWDVSTVLFSIYVRRLACLVQPLSTMLVLSPLQ